MKCAFCHTNLKTKPAANDYYKCPTCGTTQEVKLIDRPYLYTAGNGSYLEAPHVPVRHA